MPLGARLRRPQLSGTTEGTAQGAYSGTKGISEAQEWMPQFSLVPGNYQGGCYLLPGLAQ